MAARPVQSPKRLHSTAVPSPTPIQPWENTARSSQSSGMSGANVAKVDGFPRLAGVVVDVEDLHAPEAEQPRAVRVALSIGEGVVLAVDRHPLPAALPRGEPQEHPEQEIGGGMEGERSMGETAVQIDRRRDDRGLGEGERDEEYETGLSQQGTPFGRAGWCGTAGMQSERTAGDRTGGQSDSLQSTSRGALAMGRSSARTDFPRRGSPPRSLRPPSRHSWPRCRRPASRGASACGPGSARPSRRPAPRPSASAPP